MPIAASNGVVVTYTGTYLSVVLLSSEGQLALDRAHRVESTYFTTEGTVGLINNHMGKEASVAAKTTGPKEFDCV